MRIGIRAQLLSRLGNLTTSRISGSLNFVIDSWLSFDRSSRISISPRAVGRLVSRVFVGSRRSGDCGRLSGYDLIAVVDVGRIGIDVAGEWALGCASRKLRTGSG